MQFIMHPMIAYYIKWHTGSWSKRPHAKMATPKTTTTLLDTKTATTKTATLYWSKRPHCIGQNGHTGRITTKTATLHLVKTATKGESLPKRPHCIWSKRPHRKDHYQNSHTAFGQNGHTGTSLPPHLSNGCNTNHYPNGHIIYPLPGISHARGCACSHAAGHISLRTFGFFVLSTSLVTGIIPVRGGEWGRTVSVVCLRSLLISRTDLVGGLLRGSPKGLPWFLGIWVFGFWPLVLPFAPFTIKMAQHALQ